MCALDVSVQVLHLLTALHLEAAQADIDLLNGALGDVSQFVHGLDVVIEQLPAVLIQVGIVEIAYHLSRHHLEGRGAGWLPGDPIDIRAQVPLVHVIADPVADAARIHLGIARVRRGIIELEGLVRRVGQGIGMYADLDFDVLHAARVIGVGVDGKDVVGVERAPTLGLTLVGAAGIVRIALWPPDGWAGAVFAQIGFYIGPGEVQGLIE